jgi:hypothetical protein
MSLESIQYILEEDLKGVWNWFSNPGKVTTDTTKPIMQGAVKKAVDDWIEILRPVFIPIIIIAVLILSWYFVLGKVKK